MRRFFGILLVALLPCSSSGGVAPSVPSRPVYDRAGQLLQTILSSNQTYYQPVTLDQLSPWLISAVVAAEDKRFYTHSGVDIRAILRAAWQNTEQGQVVSGASTISQQLARAITPRSKTWWGKLQEAWQAKTLEQKYDKEEILEQYFNVLEFGNLTQGAQAASQFYFQVDAEELSLSQAAFLAGILKSPTYYNPLKHFQRALQRRNYVLDRMKEESFIDAEMYALAKQEKIELQVQPRPFQAPHFTRFLLPFLEKTENGVYTTLDATLQRRVEELVANHIGRLQQSNVSNAAVIVLDNDTAQVLAYVGSADFNDKKHSGQVDGVRALRQPGSALKPFVYALALEKGLITPAYLLSDEDTFFEGGFRPRNYDESYHGLVSVRNALACSYNIPAVKVAEQIGTTKLLEFLRQIGLVSLTKTPDFYGLGLALGNGEVRLLEVANAYATLARGGIFKPLQIAREPWLVLPGKTTRVLDEKTAYLITHILMDNEARSAAFGLNSPLAMPFAMAAKTGTSKDYKDNFAFGYTARWTIGVWVGNFDASSMEKVSGITGAGPILHEVALETELRYPSSVFKEPAGVVHQKVCAQSGNLAGKSCMHTREEVFDARFLAPVCKGQHTHIPLKLRIISPEEGDKFLLDPSAPSTIQQIKLVAQCPTSCHWKIDKTDLTDTSCETWWPLKPGKHTLAVQCADQDEQISFEVLP